MNLIVHAIESQIGTGYNDKVADGYDQGSWNKHLFVF